MNFKKLSTPFFLLFCIACNTHESKSTQIDSTKATEIIDTLAKQSAQPSDNKSTPNDATIQATGLIKDVDDSGYPMAYLKIEFPEKKSSEDFLINLEEVKGVDMNTLRSWKGKSVSFSYKSELTNALLDLRVKGKSIINDEPLKLSSESKKIVGTMKGATEETPGDLPSTITITTQDNKTLSFDFFVVKSMVAANNSKVEGIYEERTQNTITAIKLLR